MSQVRVCSTFSISSTPSFGVTLRCAKAFAEAQRQFLLNLGVPVGQGFLFAPGLSPDEFSRHLHGGPGAAV